MQKSKILVIEDIKDVLIFTVETLNVEGFECLGVNSGTEAIKVVKKFSPDLIICDIMMPDMDGYQVFDTIKKISSLRNVPFIFLTALSTKEELRKGMDLGADDYLTKPISYDDLISAVQSRLAKKKKENEEFEKELKSLQNNISSSIPHELLSPINNILGISSFMNNKARDLGYLDIENFSKEILKAGNKLLNIVKKFIFYTEVELNLDNPKYAEKYKNNITVSPDDIIKSIMNEIAARYGREADINVELDDLILKIENSHFKIIVNELIDNAFKFSDKSTEVSVKLGRAKDEAELIILNKGVAISPANLKRIGAFMQFDKPILNQQGIGLGLIISKRLVEFYNGSFIIKNIDDSYINVTVRFKIKEY